MKAILLLVNHNLYRDLSTIREIGILIFIVFVIAMLILIHYGDNNRNSFT